MTWPNTKNNPLNETQVIHKRYLTGRTNVNSSNSASTLQDVNKFLWQIFTLSAPSYSTQNNAKEMSITIGLQSDICVPTSIYHFGFYINWCLCLISNYFTHLIRWASYLILIIIACWCSPQDWTNWCLCLSFHIHHILVRMDVASIHNKKKES